MTDTLPPVFNRKNPLLAKISSKKLLTEGCDTKRTWHIEIDLLGSGLSFTPGDSLALLPQNDPTLASELIGVLGLTGTETVLTPSKEETTLAQALVENYAITAPDKKLLRSIAEKTGNTELSSLLEPEKKKDLANHLWGRDIIDVLQENPEAKFEASFGFLNVLYGISTTIRLFLIPFFTLLECSIIVFTNSSEVYEGNLIFTERNFAIRTIMIFQSYLDNIFFVLNIA